MTLPASLGDRKALVLALVRDRVGQERAITAEALAARVGLSERAVRELLQELIVEDGWGEIMASVGKPAGYFWASCVAEAEAYAKTLYSRGVENMRRRRAVRLAMRRLPSERPVQPKLFA